MIEAYREVTRNLEASLRRRVLNAEPTDLLSDRDDKLVEVVRDANGYSFVRRSYSPAAIRIFERAGVPFAEAWAQMQGMFEEAGIGIVPSSLIHPPTDESNFPVVAVCEYLEDDITASSVDAKVQLAAGLGALPFGKGKFLPGFELFMKDMFRVKKDEGGGDRLVLADIDPYVIHRDAVIVSMSTKDIWESAYINKISSLLSGWCQAAEKRAVFANFIRSVGAHFDFESRGDSRTFQAIMGAHSIAQGMDLRSMR